VICCMTFSRFDALEQHSACMLFNENKCEIVTSDDGAVNSFRAVMPNIQHNPCNDAVLLGASISDESSMELSAS
jgi:hypothetical protein